MMQWLAALLSCLGFFGLALAMERHRPQGRGDTHSAARRLLLRLSAATCLGLAYAASAMHAGWASGVVLWLGLASMVVPLVALVLAYRSPRGERR